MIEAEVARYRYLKSLLAGLEVTIETDDADAATAKLLASRAIISELDSIPARIKTILDGAWSPINDATKGNEK